MATYILVHGAFHGGWCWEEVKPLLEEAGHRVLAPDLPGTGEDATPLFGDVLDLWGEKIAALARAADEPVFLVGHSRGGIVISTAAEKAPDAIARLVYVAAFLLPTGTSLIDFLQEAGEGGLPAIRLPDGSAVTLDQADGPSALYHQVDRERVDRALSRLCREPIQPLQQPLELTEERYGGVPRAYILTEEDRAIPHSLQRRMISEQPCDPVICLPSDHSPFYSAPRELADALISLAKV